MTGCIVAARNNIGIIGVAYNAIARFSMSFGLGPADDADVINLSWSSRPSYKDEKKAYTSASSLWDPRDLSGEPTAARSSGFGSVYKFKKAAENGRGGLGTIVVGSGGNNRQDFDRSDSKGIQSSRWVMAIAAHGESGRIAYFSTPGSNVHVSCPGQDITSTDRTGNVGYSKDSDKLSIGTNYANGQGTSYSSPICSGIVALVIEARPDLGWRDYQEILALTALTASLQTRLGIVFAINDAGQELNGGGIRSNEDYGFGLADAFGAVRLAETWILNNDAPPRTSANEVASSKKVSPNLAIPDNGKIVSETDIQPGKPIRVMAVEIGVQITHPRIGDLTLTITSPQGTVGTLVKRVLYDDQTAAADDFGSQSANLFHRFTSLRQWGEDAAGTWTLEILDSVEGQVGTLNSWELNVVGDVVTADNLYLYTDDFGVYGANSADGFDRVNDDNGGVDTINTSPIKDSVLIDLTAGSDGKTSIKGHPVVIDGDAVIENCFTGDGDDTLVGNAAENVMHSGRGDDLLFGSPAADAMDGGQGIDTVEYSSSNEAVVVDLAASAGGAKSKGGFAEGDALSNIENLVGSNFDDSLAGSDDANNIQGGDGADTIDGRAGDDTIDGGAGSDDLNGGDGDDVIDPGFGGDDTVDGGEGSDTLLLLGHSSDYKVVFGDNGKVVITAGENKITVTNVEFVQYSDTIELLAKETNKVPVVDGPVRLEVEEGSTLRIEIKTITDSVADPEEDAIMFAYLKTATQGRAKLLTDAIEFAPLPFYNGNAEVVVTVHDGNGNFVDVTVAVTVTAVNSEPTATDSILSFPANVVYNLRSYPISGKVSAFDIDGDNLTYALVTQPLNGTIEMDDDGSFVFEGINLKAGLKLTFIYSAVDQGDLEANATVTLVLTGLVKPPPRPASIPFGVGYVDVTTPDEASEQYVYDYIKGLEGLENRSVYSMADDLLGGPKVVALASGDIVYVWAGTSIDSEGLGIAAKLFDSRGNQIGDQIQVNSYELSDQSYHAVAALADGGFVVCWHSSRQASGEVGSTAFDASGYGIFMRRYDPFGFPIGEEERVNDVIISSQFTPAITALDNTGGWVVSWSSNGQDGDALGIFAKVYASNGRASDEMQVNTFIEGSQKKSALASLPSGRWIAVWMSKSQDGDSSDIFAQLYDGTVPFGDEFIVNIGTDGSQLDPQVVAVPPAPNADDSDGGYFLISFTDLDESPGPADGYDITGVRMSADGEHIGGEIRLNHVGTSGSQSNNALAYIPGTRQIGAVYDSNFVQGQFFSSEGGAETLTFLGNGFNFAIPRKQDGSTFLDTKYTLQPSAAGNALNNGLVIAYSETDFEEKTTHQRILFLISTSNIQLTAPLTLIGGAGSDTLIGDIKDDVFLGGAGSDFYNGKQSTSSNDCVVYTKQRSEYNVVKVSAARWSVTDLDTNDVDTLVGIEVIQFADVDIRLNSAPSAVADVLVPSVDQIGEVNLLANDRDAEDGAISGNAVKLILSPEFGEVALDDDGILTLTFKAGNAIGFSKGIYGISDSEGLTARATFHIRMDCNNVTGTDNAETILTGSLDDAVDCDNTFTLTGKGGQDVFTFIKRLDATDTVLDFSTAEDQIGLKGFPSITSFEQVLAAAKQVEDDTTFTLEGEHTVTLVGVKLSSLSASNFAGPLGNAPLLVNTYADLGTFKHVQTGSAVLSTAVAKAKGNVIINEQTYKPDAYAKSLVVWESFDNDIQYTASQDLTTSQDGSGTGIFAQFIGLDGKKQGSEFRMNSATQFNQEHMVVTTQPLFGWFVTHWVHVFEPGLQGSFNQRPASTAIAGQALIYDGTKACTLDQASALKCVGNKLDLTSVESTINGRFTGAVLGAPAVVIADGIDPNRKVSGNVMVTTFYYSTPRFCCALFAKNIGTTAGALAGGADRSGYTRIDDISGTTRPSYTEPLRHISGALTYDTSATFAGQPVVIVWSYVARFTLIGPTEAEPRLGKISVFSTHLACRIINSFTAGLSSRIDIVVPGIDRESGIAAYHQITTYQVVPLSVGSVPPSSTVDKFGQFAVVHGIKRIRIDRGGEGIQITVMARKPGTADDYYAHSTKYIDSVDFGSATMRNARRRTLGLAACEVPGQGIAVAWGHSFDLSASYQPVIVVQIFDVSGTPLGPFEIASGFPRGKGSGDGVFTQPTIQMSADGNGLMVGWNQVVDVESCTSSVRCTSAKGKTQHTNIFSKTIPLTNFINKVPTCVADALNATEDTALEIPLDDIISNDKDEAANTLSLLNVKILGDKSELYIKKNGDKLSADNSGKVSRREETETREGLSTRYFPSETAVTYRRSPFNRYNGKDFKAGLEKASPNIYKFPPDIVGVLKTFRQEHNPLSAWAGLPRYMRANFNAVVDGLLTLDTDDVVQFHVHARTSGTLFIDEKEVYYTKMRSGPAPAPPGAPPSPPVFATAKAGHYIQGTGLVSLSAGAHTIRLEYSSIESETASSFEVMWRRQSEAETGCAICDEDDEEKCCKPLYLYQTPALSTGVDQATYDTVVNEDCCGVKYAPIPPSMLSHKVNVLSDETIPYIYTPPINAFGTAILEYEIVDEKGFKCTSEIAVSIEPLNDAPTASNLVFQLDSKRGQLQSDDGSASCDDLESDDVVDSGDDATLAKRLRFCTAIFSKLDVEKEALFANVNDVDGTDVTLVKLTGESKLTLGKLAESDDAGIAFVYIPTTGYRVGDAFFVDIDTLGFVVADEPPDEDRASATITLRVRVPLTLCAAGSSFETTAATTSSDRACQACSACTATTGKAGICEGDKCIAAGLYEQTDCDTLNDRVCARLTPCDLTVEYESKAPLRDDGNTTFVSDRECTALTVCKLSEFVSTAETATSDRKCAVFRTCDENEQFESKAPVPRTNDRECSAVSNCPPGTFISKASTKVTDVVCAPCADDTYQAEPDKNECIPQTSCGQGQKISAGSKTEARTCAACEAGTTYQPEETHREETCIEATVCPTGTRISTALTGAADRKCTECNGISEWQDKTNQPRCKQANICKPGEETDDESSPTTDRTCRSCEQGATFQNKGGETKCKTVRQCAVGQEEDAAPTLERDRVCKQCASGTFQNQPGKLKCKSVLQCGLGKEESKRQTTAADRECSACKTGFYQAKETGTQPCEAWLQCDQGEETDVAPTTSTDRQCRRCEAGEFQDAENQKDCKGHTVCPVGQDVDVEATATRDRTCKSCVAGTTFKNQEGQQECTAVTVCTEGEEESSSPTISGDRTCKACVVGKSFQNDVGKAKCKQVRSCKQGEEEDAEPTLKSDRTCKSCASGFYQNEKAKLACIPISECGVASEETTVHTPSADRVCTRCKDGFFQAKTSGTHSCIPWSNCDSGLVTDTKPSAGSDRTCRPCGAGTYKPEPGQVGCRLWTECDAGEEETLAPTLSKDRECSACKANFFKTEKGSTACLSHHLCGPGQEDERPPSATRDRLCRPCELAVTFQPKGNEPTCLPVSPCKQFLEYEKAPPTLIKDRECELLTTCDGDVEYELKFPTPTSNRECATLTECTLGKTWISKRAEAISDRQCTLVRACNQSTEFEILAFTASSDRVCNLLRTCNYNASKASLEFESIAPTATTDRGCTSVNVCDYPGKEYEESPPSFDKDRMCLPLTRCKQTEFELVPSTPFADRKCSAVRKCNESTEFLGRAATNTTDAVCVANNVCGGREAQPLQYVSEVSLTNGGNSKCVAVRANCDVEADGEFEAVAPTLTSDRVCAPLTLCKENEFQRVQPTLSSDRSCELLKVCHAGLDYELLKPTPITDRVCSAVVNCTADVQYQFMPPTLASNRICRNISAKCDFDLMPNISFPPVGAQSFQVRGPSEKQDRLCLNVSFCDFETAYLEHLYNDYDLLEVGAMRNTWKNWKVIFETPDLQVTDDPELQEDAEAEGISLDLGRAYGMTDEQFIEIDANGDNTLDQSELLTFKAQHDMTALNTLSQRTIFPWSVEARPPSADYVCTPLTVCNALLEYELLPKTMQNDRICEKLSKCIAGVTYESTRPTATSDRKCENVSACSYNTSFEARPPTATENRICTPFQQCTLGSTYQTQAPSNTTDRVCEDVAACKYGETYEIISPTISSDRACRDVSVCDLAKNLTVLKRPTLLSDVVCIIQPTGAFVSATTKAVLEGDTTVAVADVGRVIAGDMVIIDPYGAAENATVTKRVVATDSNRFRRADLIEGVVTLDKAAVSSHDVGTTVFFFRSSSASAFDDSVAAGTNSGRDGDTAFNENGGGSARGKTAVIAIVIVLLLGGGFVFFRRYSKATTLAEANRNASIDELIAIDSPKPFEVTNQAFIGCDQDSTIALDSVNVGEEANDDKRGHKDEFTSATSTAVIVDADNIAEPAAGGHDSGDHGGARAVASITSPNETDASIAKAEAAVDVGGIITPTLIAADEASIMMPHEADATPVGAVPVADADLYEAATALPGVAVQFDEASTLPSSAAGATPVGAVPAADADLYEAATALPEVAAGPSVPSRNNDTAFARNLARLILDDDGGGGDHVNGEEATCNAEDAIRVAALESFPSPPVLGPEQAQTGAGTRKAAANIEIAVFPKLPTRALPEETPATALDLGEMKVYYHGAINRTVAEERLRAAGASFRYLFRAKNNSSVVMSVRYTEDGKHRVQHSMLSEVVLEGSERQYMLDSKPFDESGACLSLSDALRTLVELTSKRVGKVIYPVRDPIQLGSSNGAGGAYQNTSWETMSAFVSELPQMDRADAENMLEGKSIDGGFMLRLKAAQNVVVTCMVSSGTFQHHAVSLAETASGQSAAWVYRGKAVEEQSLVEAARCILRDNHIQTPTWVGAGSGVFSSEA